MENLTQKERIDLESVFAVIYTKKESKILFTYKDLCVRGYRKWEWEILARDFWKRVK